MKSWCVWLVGGNGWTGGGNEGSLWQVAQVEKFSESSGLGISLEADSGHHYIRSVLPEGPVGRCGKLFSGDELLEAGPILFLQLAFSMQQGMRRI